MTDDRDFSRQSFLGPNAERKLAETRVAIVGLGGGGSHIAQQLAHVGVGHYRLIDPQAIEASNLNRLVGATKADLDAGRPKVEILRRTILGVRPWADVQAIPKNWQKVDALIKDAHVLFGCVDGYGQRDYLEGAARRFGLPYIDIGMDVTKLAEDTFAVSGQMIMTRPDGPCMRCLGFLTPDRLSQEENRYGDAGINPQVVWTNGTLASLAVGAFMQLMTPWSKEKNEYWWLELDGNKQTVTPSQQPKYFPRQNPCPHYAGGDSLGDPFYADAAKEQSDNVGREPSSNRLRKFSPKSAEIPSAESLGAKKSSGNPGRGRSPKAVPTFPELGSFLTALARMARL